MSKHRLLAYRDDRKSWLCCAHKLWSERAFREVLAQSNQKYRVFKTPLAEILERWHLQRMLRYSFCAFVISLSVQTMLLPLQVVYFHRLSIASIFLNIGVSILMGVISLLALAAVGLTLVSTTVATPLVALVNALNWLMTHGGDVFAWCGLDSMRLPEYSGWKRGVYFCYYAPLLVLCSKLQRWLPVAASITPQMRRPLGWLLVQCAFIAVLLTHPFSVALNKNLLKVDFLDVGQGDSALVTMPDGSTLLVDGGGQTNFLKNEREDGFERDVRPIGDAVVSEFLWSRGLKQVDYILATHADADHIDGLNDVARNFHIRSALAARSPLQDLEYEKFANTLRSEAIPTTVIGAGDKLQFAGVTATVLWPPPSNSSHSTSHNNDSVVMRLQFGNSCVILTGDIERPGESLLLRAAQDLRCDVVKVAHHGSKTSSIPEFVRATQPRLAIVSVGQKSMFGHPHREVVERWRGAGAEVMTTGRCGAITLTSDGKEIRVDSFVPECR